jgi:hypothetical protein
MEINTLVYNSDEQVPRIQVKGAAIGGLAPTRGSVPLHLLATMMCLEMWQALLA